MQYNRWYDNNQNLKIIIDSIITAHQNNLDSIAYDLIQVMFEKQPDKDDFLEIISKNINSQKDRWYDNNYMFHSAIEMLKFVSPEAAERILKETLYLWQYEDKIDEYEDFHRH
ncbi:MAG TPA: hypothetical protein P5556_05980 [Candidatus Gastranaerophilales bacterium]|nr:hypothetical protein [Candidatus Gastranaerophilales bacterium]